MTNETERLLGSLDAGLAALRAEHDRRAAAVDENFSALRGDIVALRVDVATLKTKAEAESERSSSLGPMRHAITAIIGALAGFGGGHTPIPGAH